MLWKLFFEGIKSLTTNPHKTKLNKETFLGTQISFIK